MEYIRTHSLVEGNTYMVWFEFEDGIFILHAQGNRKKLYRQFKELLKLVVPIYFCEGFEGAWINHREEVEPGIFRLKYKGIE